jgi:hypothetical protein
MGVNVEISSHNPKPKLFFMTKLSSGAAVGATVSFKNVLFCSLLEIKFMQLITFASKYICDVICFCGSLCASVSWSY